MTAVRTHCARPAAGVARASERHISTACAAAAALAFAAAAVVTARDDLQTIKGVGPFIEEKLNALGITTFRQVANMTPELEDQVNTAIEFFPGRVRRDKWAKQAEDLDN